MPGTFERYLKTEAKKNAHVGTAEAEGLGPDTARKRISHAKQFFGDAVEHEVIDRNPFAKLKASVIGNRDRDFFVTLEMVGKVLDACPDAQWRLMVALSRFGGLRCPSEILALRLDSADWDAGRIRVDSPKTEHHDGKAYRIIPMFPQLRPYFEERWHQAGTWRNALHQAIRTRAGRQLAIRPNRQPCQPDTLAEAVAQHAGQPTD